MPNRSLLKTPASAAFLSFLFPGLGQLAAGRPRRGLVVALPALTLSVAVAGFFLFARRQIYDAIFSADALTSFFLIDVAILLYRLWAIVDAFLVAGGPGARTGLAPKIQTKEPAARARSSSTDT